MLDKAHGDKCLTKHPDFRDNMLSEGILKIDVCRYLEENWPLDDADLEKVHKLYRLVAYQRCSRWIFQILGKKSEDHFLPVCIQVYENVLRRLVAFIRISNMQKHQNGNILCLIGYF